MKGFYESTTQTQETTWVQQVQRFQNGEGLTRKNANWIVFASTAAKLDLLLGVCLILETFYGYSKLACWIDPAQPGPVWKVFIFGSVRSTLSPCDSPMSVFVCPLWAPVIVNLTRIMMWLIAGIGAALGPVARAKLHWWLASGAGIAHHMRWRRHVTHAGSLEGGFTPPSMFQLQTREVESQFLLLIIWCPCEYMNKGCSL